MTTVKYNKAKNKINVMSDIYCHLVCGTPLQYSCLENPMDGGAW